MNKMIKQILPKSYTLNTMEKPMHAGEIYHLWESLTASYQGIEIAEFFLMNTEDKELHGLLQKIVTGAESLRVNKIEPVLKDAGFTVPPRPASKMLQGKPGVGQEIKLDNNDVIKTMYDYMSELLNLDGRGIGVVTSNKKIRNIFIELVNDDMKLNDLILNVGKQKHIIEAPPAATSTPNSLNISEVHWLWFHLRHKHSALVVLETYLYKYK